MLRKLAEAWDERHERKSLGRLTAAFNEQMRAYEAANFATQVGAELSARTLHHAFIACFPQVADFVNAPHSEQQEYLNKVCSYIQELSKNEKAGAAPSGVTHGAVLVQFWITALAWRNLELADAMAKQLEPLNRSAYETACAMGQAKPDEKVIAEWKDMFGENFDPNSLLDSI